MESFATFMQELRARKVRRTIAIYTSTGLTLLGVTNLFTGVYQLPRTFFDCMLVLLLCGFPSACLLAWFHGAEGKQKVQRKELVLHSVFFLIAAFVILDLVLPGGPPLIAAGSKSIAVLPFRNLSDSKEDEYFSDGITEDIITQLSKIGQLQVISRTSVMKFKNTTKTAREIGRELNVATLLEGSVRRAGNRVRIDGHLIDAGNDRPLWGETYDRNMSDIFAIQSEVAQNIAGALKATLSPSERKQLERKSTENLDAYAYYLRGREYYYLYTKNDNERAIELFKKALALDPRYALAYAGLGDAYDRRQWYGFPAEIWNDSAIAVSNLAITLDPNAAEGYKALGNAFQSRGELRHALELYEKAVKLNPNYAPVFANISSVDMKLGRLDGAIMFQRKAVTLQPGFPRWSGQLALYYFFLGYDSLTTVWSQKTLELQPDFFLPHLLIGYVQMLAGKFDQARESIGRALSFGPNEYLSLVGAGDVELYAGRQQQAMEAFTRAIRQTGPTSELEIKLAYALRKLGNQKAADTILDSLLAANIGSFAELQEGSDIPYYVAAAYAIKGNAAQAIRWLRKGVDLGYQDPRGLPRDPLLEGLYENAQFRAIAVEVEKKTQEMRNRVDAEGLSG